MPGAPLLILIATAWLAAGALVVAAGRVASRADRDESLWIASRRSANAASLLCVRDERCYSLPREPVPAGPSVLLIDEANGRTIVIASVAGSRAPRK
jgi:hypothetical protein